MTSHEIRRKFLDFFAERDHLVRPSASLIPYEDDPTVLLTVAGMLPFKSYFLGQAKPPAPRLTSAQKCFRTVDIDQVGRTARHLTFFEMLGNFSIGDYFKHDAIAFAFDLSTEVLGFDPEQIWITVFEGMDGVDGDEEAVERWVEVGIPRDRIQALGEADNFWKAGPTGPCGPCSELYLDRGERFGPPGGPVTGTDRFLEYWNLVFMQYDRGADGALTPLPAKNIDTGAGLERIAAIVQGKDSVFETDAFRPIIAWAERESGRRYGSSPRDDVALRVMADHGRAMTFLTADGVRPGNEGRDYVLRRIIRRAVSEGGHLGLDPMFVVALARQVTELWGDAYPELVKNRETVADALGAEAEQFARTLANGTRMLREVIASAAEGRVSGDDAFRLFDTYGFPLDLTLDAAEQAGLAVDTERFAALMDEQRERARHAAKRDDDPARPHIEALAVASPPATFVGYDALTAEATITGARDLGGGEWLVTLDRSPFYAQGGGQVSDVGDLTGGDLAAEVTDVVRVGDDQVLRLRVTRGAPAVGAGIVASVDAASRRSTQANHTGTHLLNWALRETLGGHVRQAGSYVGPDKLRFDFTHRDRLDESTRARIEEMVNGRVAADVPVTATLMPRTEADASGAIGLFEEKYGEVVRVVDAGPGSRELCGGTHVASTGEIGAFKLLVEQGIGAGTRRIEAVTGAGVLAWHRERETELARELAAKDARIAELERDLKRAREARVDPATIAAGHVALGPVRLVAVEVEAAEMDDLLTLSDRIKASLGTGACVVLAARTDGKAMLAVNLEAGAVSAGLSAVEIVRTISPHVDGGGGGRDTVARAGGKRPGGIPDALAAADALVRARVA